MACPQFRVHRKRRSTKRQSVGSRGVPATGHHRFNNHFVSNRYHSGAERSCLTEVKGWVQVTKKKLFCHHTVKATESPVIRCQDYFIDPDIRPPPPRFSLGSSLSSGKLALSPGEALSSHPIDPARPSTKLRRHSVRRHGHIFSSGSQDALMGLFEPEEESPIAEDPQPSPCEAPCEAPDHEYYARIVGHKDMVMELERIACILPGGISEPKDISAGVYKLAADKSRWEKFARHNKRVAELYATRHRQMQEERGLYYLSASTT